MKNTILFGAVLLSLAAFTNASANITTTYADTTIHWANYGNNTVDDVTDVIGSPQITSMAITTNNAATELRRIKLFFNTEIPDATLFGNFSGIRDGLFINKDGTGTNGWDYFIQGVYDGSSSAFNYTLYDVTSDDYIMSNELTNLGISSYRELHPVAIKQDALSNGRAINVTDKTLSLKYVELNDLNIKIGQNYAISYMNACANDVIVGATPIPAPFLLFGSALLGVFGFKKFKKDTV